MKNNVRLNIFSTFLYQILYTISGIILPKMILLSFGSAINGLSVSLTNALNFFTIVEGGLAAVLLTSLYKPLNDNDNEKVSSIIKTADSFYKKLALLTICFTLIIGVGYSVLINEFSFTYIFTLALLIAIPTITNYCVFSLRTLIVAKENTYIVQFTKCVFVVINIVFIYIAIKIFRNIHWVKLLSGIAYLILPITFYLYSSKNYKLDKNASVNNSLISQRWDGFAHNLANYIHTIADTFLLTVFSTLENVSIYSIYETILLSLKGIIDSISGAIIPTLGLKIHSDEEKDKRSLFITYKLFVLFFVVVIFSTTLYLIIPFIRIYTQNIKDANYVNGVFAFILVIAECINCIKIPYIEISNIHNCYKRTKHLAYIETFVNLIISIILVHKYNIVGVAIGTLVAMIIRLLTQIIFVDKKIYNINPIIDIINSFLILILVVFNACILNLIVPIEITSYYSWCVCGVISVIFSAIIYVIILFIFKREYIRNIIKEYIN